MNRNGFIVPLVIFAVLALAVVGAIVWVHYYYLPRVSQNSQTAQPVTTYQNNLITQSTSSSNIDFSQPFSLGQAQGVRDVGVSDDRVIWLELTGANSQLRQSFPDIYDLFLFQFDPQTGTGSTVRLTSLKPGQTIESAYIFDGEIYWTEYGNDLYHYNRVTHEPELLAANVITVFGVYQNKLLFDRATNLSNPSLNQQISYYTYDLTQKQEAPLDFTVGTSPLYSGGNNICFAYATSSGIYAQNINTGASQPIISSSSLPSTLDAQDFKYGLYDPTEQVVGCSDGYLAYVFSGEWFGEDQQFRYLHIYNADTKTNVFTTSTDGAFFSQVKFFGDSAIYSTKSNISYINLSTGMGGSIVSFASSTRPDQYPGSWDTDGNYVAYAEQVPTQAGFENGIENGIEVSNLFIQKIAQSQ